MIVPPKPEAKGMLWRFVFFPIILLTTIFASVLLIPSLRNRAVTEFTQKRYPIVPKSEFQKNTPVTLPDKSTYYSSNDRQFYVKGLETKVVYPDGGIERRYLGKVTALPRDEWALVLGADNSVRIPSKGQAIDLLDRYIGVTYGSQRKILSVPENTVTEAVHLAKGGAKIRTVERIEDIQIDDVIQLVSASSSSILYVYIY